MDSPNDRRNASRSLFEMRSFGAGSGEGDAMQPFTLVQAALKE